MDNQNNDASNGQNFGPKQEPIINKKNNKTIMGILSYLGFLIIIPYLVAKDDQFIKFHIRQGLVLVCIEIVVWILGNIMWQLWPLISIVNLATLVLSIIGIINVVQNKEKELPIVGKFSKHFSV